MPKITAKIDYACKAILELSLHWPNTTPLQVDIIGKRQQIPNKFLTQILLNLKQLGFVDSVRGKNGGYTLNKAPRKIKLSEVVKGMGGLGSPAGNGQNSHVMETIWQDVDDAVNSTMKEMNFEIIRQRARSQEHVMMYGI